MYRDQNKLSAVSRELCRPGASGEGRGEAYLCSGSHVASLVKGHRERHKHQMRGGMASSLPGLS